MEWFIFGIGFAAGYGVRLAMTVWERQEILRAADDLKTTWDEIIKSQPSAEELRARHEGWLAAREVRRCELDRNADGDQYERGMI